MKKYLLEHGIIQPDQIRQIADRVRDQDNVAVWKCLQTEMIFLDLPSKNVKNHYEQKTLDVSNLGDMVLIDDQRRAAQWLSEIKNKDWLDFGCGAGGLLKALVSAAKKSIGVELSLQHRQHLKAQGLEAAESIDELADQSLDVATLFHVFEHLTDPILLLKDLRKKMKASAKIIIEVPHALDFLIEEMNCEAFKNFTFWSEHLILHSQKSLRLFLNKAGFEKIEFAAVQRYPLSNHLHWLNAGKPGGHNHLKHLQGPELNQAYENQLKKLNRTDTIVAIVSN